MKSVLLACASLLGSVASAQTLIHSYTFNTDASDQVGAIHGSLFGGASVSGGRLVLDGTDDYLEFGGLVIPTSGHYTLALSAQQVAFGGAYVELLSQSSGALYFGYDPSHRIRIGDSYQNTGLNFPSDGLLHHYALTNDGTNLRLYIDGAIITTVGALPGGSGGTNTRLGRQYDGHAEYFNGGIDDFFVYDEALTSGQVAALAAIPEPSTISFTAAAGLLGIALRARTRRSRQ